MAAEKVKTELICPSPDIVLVIGQPPQVKLMVSSAVLKNASAVSAAMLGPQFREGQEVESTAQPKEINLPDDNPETVSDMCHMLHSKTVHKYLTGASAATILELAITIDKYACVDALRMQAHAILLGNLDLYADLDLATNGQRMVAAYLLDNSRAFRLSTGRLISGVTTPYSSLLLEEWACHISPMALYGLEAKRSEAQRNLLHNLASEYLPQPDVDYARFITQLCKAVDVSTWPPKLESHSIDQLLSYVKKMNTINTNLGQKLSTAKLASVVKALEENCDGLCLACVKEQNADVVKQCTEKLHGRR
ncbi:uncharacterized protein LTR77_005492 [Saxophila tyrrhenica]|uniref:BTB domain-containing protein n=1 Tax=Saxophila tyrrhenica TaxID=1690608 RepID=A0AAV9P8M1_9PEZI|nr:hypothetical protein LTR77_005492 [Saxophila tyrrhenica]